MRHNKSVLHLHALHFMPVECGTVGWEGFSHVFRPEKSSWNCVELQLSREADEPT